MRKSLDKIMEHHGSDKADANGQHNYCVKYEKWFEPLRDLPLLLLELGIGGEDKELGGASLKSWEEYFPNAKIAGVDIYPKGVLDTDRIRTYTGRQEDPVFLKYVLDTIGVPDIIIDDASHRSDLTIKSFQLLFPHLKKGGIYTIEDISCSYRWDFGGSIKLDDMYLETPMNYLFSMLHNLNPVRNGNPDYKDIPEFAEVESVHFYPDIVIIKKK